MATALKDRTENLKRVTHTNAAHLNEALKIIGEQQAEIDRLTRVTVEWERDMNGTLATLEAERQPSLINEKALEAVAKSRWESRYMRANIHNGTWEETRPDNRQFLIDQVKADFLPELKIYELAKRKV